MSAGTPAPLGGLAARSTVVRTRYGARLHRRAGDYHTGCGRDIERDATRAEIATGHRCRQCFPAAK